jgi:hypothetical protein
LSTLQDGNWMIFKWNISYTNKNTKNHAFMRKQHLYFFIMMFDLVFTRGEQTKSRLGFKWWLPKVLRI